jgi:integration host factor subunit alpha
MHAENLPQLLSIISRSAPREPDKTSRTVTRSDIVTAIMKRVPSLSRRQAMRIFECALQEISDALSQREESVKLHEFGTFFVRERTDRLARNPVTGENACVHKRKTLIFRASLGLKEKVEKLQAQTPPHRS